MEQEGKVYGFNGGKKVKERKRFILVDTLGLLISVVLLMPIALSNEVERL